MGAAFLWLCALDPCVRGSLSFVRASFPYRRGLVEDGRGGSSVRALDSGVCGFLTFMGLVFSFTRRFATMKEI